MEPIASLPSRNVKYLYGINTLLMIKPDVTKNKITIRKFKDDSVFLLNDAKNILHDKPIKKDV